MKKNRRTLKKRIRRVIFLCIFISTFVFSMILILLIAEVFKSQAASISEYSSSSTAQTMNSQFFLNQMGITGLEEFKPDSAHAKEWLNTMKRQEPPMKNPPAGFNKGIVESNTPNALSIDINGKEHGVNIQNFNIKNMIYTSIVLNGTVVFSNENTSKDIMASLWGSNEHANNANDSWISKILLDYYSNAESKYDLYDSKGNVIGNVTTKFNSQFLTFIFMALAISIILVGILSLLIANIFSRLFTIPITTPLTKLDDKIKAIAAENYEGTTNTQIILKKPLREIESLADSTNLIMNKMKNYSNLLQDQKVVLENQNEELEAQNEELTESKKQLEDAQAMLVQHEKMASIGQLTAAITHEINTPLGAINSNVQICDMLTAIIKDNPDIQANSELGDMVAQLKDANNISLMACRRVSEIIRSLKNFSRLDQAEYQESDINEGIKSVLILTSNLWKKKISIHEDYGSLPMVKCFPGLLNQVFMNIVVNAIQAIDKNGDICIKTYTDDENLFISIKDNGSGISEENLSRIFDSGFTTKGAGIGMGLGLSICHNVIEKHKGAIKVTSEPGKGTEFIVSIPLAPKQA